MEPCKQRLLRLSLPAGGPRIFPNAFREALAKTNALPAAFFHFGPDERPMNGKPPVKIIGGQSWLGILADESAFPLLDAAIPIAIRTLSALTGRAVPVEIEDHTLDLARRHAPVIYYARELVVRKGWFHGITQEKVAEIVKTRILAGIVETAQRYGLDCPTDDELALNVLDISEPKGLKMIMRDGPHGSAMLCNVIFSVDAQLTGFWFAGNLTARGYGRMGLHLPSRVAKLKVAA